MLLRKGDQVTAKWKDGLIFAGTYVGSESGFIILKTADGERVICGSTVTLTKTKPDAKKQ